MARDTGRVEVVPALEKLPKGLRKAMVNLMSREDLELEQAYERATTLLEVNSEAFDKAVNSKSNSIYKSRHITELNKARGTMKRESDLNASTSYKRGYSDGLEDGKKKYAIDYRCSICNEPIIMVPMSEDHKAMVQYMHEHGWHHSIC